MFFPPLNKHENQIFDSVFTKFALHFDIQSNSMTVGNTMRCCIAYNTLDTISIIFTSFDDGSVISTGKLSGMRP